VLERIPWPRHGSTPLSRAHADAEIALQRYDVALIASEEPEAYDLAAPVPRRIGFTTGWAKPLKSLWIRRRVTTAVRRAATVRGADAHEAEILLRLAVGLADAVLQRLTRALRERGACFIAAPGERDAVRAQFPALTVAAPATTRDWIATVDAAAALVSPDTGASHLAGMIGVPVVDVFPDAGFDAQTRRWRPWASSSIVVRASELALAPETLIPQALDAL
jgi:hypothetical protein